MLNSQDTISDRQRLETLAQQFIDTFNTNDLDGMMAFFADDAIYDEFNGACHHGKAEIRKAFTPQFEGAFGTMAFLDEDLFIDPDTGKVMASWRCTLEIKGQPTSWRGLDLLHFKDDKVIQKLTYAKTKVPLFQDA